MIFNPKVQIATAAFSKGKAALRGNGAINEPGWASWLSVLNQFVLSLLATSQAFKGSLAELCCVLRYPLTLAC